VQRAPATHGAAPLPVQRMDDYGYGGGHGGGYGGPGRGYAPPQVAESESEPEREWSPKEVRDTIAAWGAQPPMKDYGARRQGQAHEEFHMRFPRSWQGEETEQTLSDTSALLFDSVKESRRLTGAVESEHAKEREVQGMLINDRLVFATNLNSSVDSLMRAGQQRDRHGRTTDPTLEQLLRIQQTDRARTAHMSERERRNTRLLHDAAARKNAAIFSEQRGEGEQGRGRDATAMALRAKMGAPVIVVDVDTPNLHELLTSREYEGRVFLLRFAALDPKSSKKSKSGQTAEQSMHAEQKLLLALHRAGIRPREDVRGPISIMGKYRPCMGCAAALYYYRHTLGFEGLTFDENYGHLFQGSVDSLYDHHRHIMDENYLGYIEQMIYEDITSTPAMANEAPPQNAEFRRGGYSVRVPGKYAAKRAVVTPSQSDAEFDDEGGYKRVIRPMEETWDFETAPVGIGEGADHTPMPRRKFEGLSDTAAEELRTLWNGSKSSPATNASRQRAVELFDEYNAGGMTFEYLGAVVGRDPGRINSEVARYRETEAHRTHVPSRSSKTVTEARAKTKGVFKKGGELDEHARNIIDDAVQRNADHPWSREWLRLHNEALAREEGGLPVKDEGDEVVLSAVDAPADVLKAVAGLQRGGSSYDVGKLARYLHAGGRDKMKSAIRKGNNLLDGKGREAGKKKDKGKTVDKSTSKRTHRQPAVRVKSEDVEMAGASSYPPAPQAPAPYDYEGGYEGGYATTAHDPAGGQGMMPAYQQQPTPTVPELLPSVWTVNPYEQGASGASSSSQAPLRTDTVPGYTTQYDHATGQQFFVDPDTGLRYFRINGQMVPESYEDYEDTRMGGTQDDYYYR
jgi:hypothetical protein